MASSINASTSGVGGVITTADASGVLQLQTAGTTALTVNSSGAIAVGTSASAYGTSGQVLTSQGNAAPTWTTISSPISTKLITDSTDIALQNYATPSYSNVGSSFSESIPANGFIRLSSIALRLLSDANSTNHHAFFGIRISSVNYWFNTYNDNGTLTINPTISVGTSANQYREYNGIASGGANVNSARTAALDVAALSIPSGTQTVQLIAAFGTTASTIKGTVKQTRIILEFVSA